MRREELLRPLRPPEGFQGADVTMAQLVECVPNFSEGRNKEVEKLIIFYQYFMFVCFEAVYSFFFVVVVFFKVSN